jgi:hypothetical protein
MRIPFFMMAMGTEIKAKRNTFHPVRKYKWPAKRQVMKSATLERMPLHSLATSMVTPGKDKMNP